MVVLRKDENPTLRRRVSEGVMTVGVVGLLGALVGAFVVVPVLLLQSSRRKEADEAEALQRAEAKKSASAEAPAGRPAPKSEVASAKPPPLDPPRLPKPEAQPISVAPAAPAAPPVPAPRDAQAVDPEGFIRHWLVLAPIRSPQAPFSGSQEVHKAQIPNEARIRPREGDRQIFPDKERVWVRHGAPEYFIDFKKLVGPGRSDDAIAYAVAYVHAPQAMSGLRLLMGSNVPSKVYLNGAHLLVVDKTRMLEKDQNVANDVQLKPGENLLVFKVVNEKQGWQGCIRFTDRQNQPIRTLLVATAPQ